MTLRQKIEKILLNRVLFKIGLTSFREDTLDEIMNEISKEVYGKPLHGMK